MESFPSERVWGVGVSGKAGRGRTGPAGGVLRVAPVSLLLGKALCVPFQTSPARVVAEAPEAPLPAAGPDPSLSVAAVDAQRGRAQTGGGRGLGAEALAAGAGRGGARGRGVVTNQLNL